MARRDRAKPCGSAKVFAHYPCVGTRKDGSDLRELLAWFCVEADTRFAAARWVRNASAARRPRRPPPHVRSPDAAPIIYGSQTSTPGRGWCAAERPTRTLARYRKHDKQVRSICVGDALNAALTWKTGAARACREAADTGQAPAWVSAGWSYILLVVSLITGQDFLALLDQGPESPLPDETVTPHQTLTRGGKAGRLRVIRPR
jgi:hypothetical protein